MPLTYLLYRCPRCGHDPLRGEKDEAWCPGCGVRFSRGGEGALIRVQEGSGEIWEVPGHRLVAAMEARGPGDASYDGPTPGLPRRTDVKVRRSGLESPVRWNGHLLGFAEAMGEAAPGVLTLHEESLEIRMDPGAPPALGTEEGGAQEEAGLLVWPLLELRAVQTSSSSLQFSPSSGGLVELRFPQDSPFRWESLLREALRRAYRRAGRGEIVEFQPRIVTE